MSYHIGAKPGDIAESILLPGDPLRAKYIAENFLEDAVCFNEIRGMYGYTGTWKGKRVSVMGTGMGIPQITIYVHELCETYGVQNLIRIGTCGALRPEMGLMDIVLAMGCCTDNDMNTITFNGSFAPLADFELLNKAHDIAGEKGIPVVTGPVNSIDILYRERPEIDQNWARYGVVASEMEGAALYTVAAKFGRRALCMLSVSDSRYIERKLTFEEKEQGLNNMIEIALDTAIAF